MEIGAINAAIDTLNYVIENFSDDFLIHVENTTMGEFGLEIKHFIFGCVDWSLYDNTRWHTQNRFFPKASVADTEKLIRQSEGHDYTNIVLLSNDIIYKFSFDVNNEFPRIKIDLSSAVFGKGTFYNYLKIALRHRTWQMYSEFPRGTIYNRQKGTLNECLDIFRMTEKKMEHPYQEFIQRYLDVYRNATKNKRKFI